MSPLQTLQGMISYPEYSSMSGGFARAGGSYST